MTTHASHDSETLAKGQQVITVCALLHKNDSGIHKVFLPRRASTKKFLPDVFELPGGHVDFGEELEAGLQREIREEFGMETKIGSPFAAFTYVNDVKGSHSVEIVYFATFIGDESQITLNPADHSEYMWLSAEELPQAYTETKGADDIEFECLKNGLALLDGAQPNYATKMKQY